MRSKRIKIRGVKLLAVCFLFVAGCSNTYRRTFVVSGTYLTVTSADKRAAKIVYDEFKRLDAIFNPYDPDSEISQLHASIPHAVIVSYEMFELLELSQEVATLTQGSFDVTKGAVYQLWKELIHNGKDARFPSVDEVKRRLATSGIKYIESYRDEGRCAITKKGLRLDFSGIAKGYMVDKAIAKLKEAGIESALIDAGGDIYCLGADNGKPWRVGVREPVLKQGIIDTVQIVDEAIATSGTYEQFFEHKGKRYSHIIDPKTGFPVRTNLVSVTVIAKNATTADALATAFFVMGIEGIKEFLDRVPSNMKIYAVTIEDGKKNLHIF